MSSSPQIAHQRKHAQGVDSEAGYVLVAVLFLVALILIALAVAAPRIAQSIQRDRELELVHRGEQYKRAVKLYYKKFGAYPSSIDQLVNTNQIRFLRKRYTDPMTGKDDWKIIHQGEQHVPAMGLFGQPLANGTAPGTAGSSVAGLGSNGVTAGGLGSTTGTGFGSTPQSGTTGTGQSGTDGSQNGTTGSSGFGNGATGPGSSGFGSGTSGSTNPTFGGGPIVGFAIPNTKASIKEYKQQKHYNEWEFVYNPLEEQMQAGTLFGGAAQNVNGTGATGTGIGTGNGLGTGTGGGVTTPGSGSGGTTQNPQQ
jgi:type II secretory pathway pseudopilin PulG